MEDYAQLVIEKLSLDPNLQLKKTIRGLNGITVYQLIDSLIKYETVLEAANSLGYTDNPVKQCIRQILHPVLGIEAGSFEEKGSRMRWYVRLLSIIEHKKCYKCGSIKLKSEFAVNNSRYDCINSLCKTCDLIKTKQRKYYIAERTPEWAELDLIEQFYSNCPKGYHVDHIIPLQGKIVSGLRVLENLQYLKASENLSKSNKFYATNI